MTRPPLRAVVAAVAVGGALGACLRWALGVAVPDGGGFPWTTFGINVTGSLLLALLPVSSTVRRHALLPPLLGTGVLGGFTTLSAASEQARVLLADGHRGLAASYTLGTLACCLVAVALANRFSSVAALTEFEQEEGTL